MFFPLKNGELFVEICCFDMETAICFFSITSLFFLCICHSILHFRHGLTTWTSALGLFQPPPGGCSVVCLICVCV